MTPHITIAFDKPQVQIVLALQRFHLQNYNITLNQEAAQIFIEIHDEFLLIGQNKLYYPLLLSDFVYDVRACFYEKYIHECSVKNDIYDFDAQQRILSTSKGQISLTLKEILLLMPIWQNGSLSKVILTENEATVKKIREKLSLIGLSLSGDLTYDIIKKI